MRALLVSADLMLISTAGGMADRHGVELTIAAASEAASKAAGTRLITIDLRAPALAVASLVAALRQAASEATIVAFGPHVHTEALSAAVEAGCDEVITRGQFERRFDALLAALTAPAAKDRQ
jgi:DNA-binding response OmpR family regulator